MRCDGSRPSWEPVARPIARSAQLPPPAGRRARHSRWPGRRAAAGEDIAAALATALGQRARFAAAAVSLQLRAGGDLPALLRSLARRLDERRGVNAEIRALTAQARLSARVVPLLPVVGLALAALLDAGAVRLLLTTAPGLAIVAVAAVLDLAGLLAIRAIARGIG